MSKLYRIPMITHTVKVNKVFYKSEDFGIAGATIIDDDNTGKITMLGNISGMINKAKYVVHGVNVDDKKYGKQFKVSSYCEPDLNSQDEMFDFLASGCIRGIGQKTARLISKKFGDETKNILFNDVRRLQEIRGIGEKKIIVIEKSINELKSLFELRDFFVKYNCINAVTNYQCKKIIDMFKTNIIEKIKENPYSLMRIRGITFDTSDSVAKSIGFPLNSRERFSAGAIEVLKKNETLGNTAMIGQEFYENITSLLIVPGEYEVDDIVGQVNYCVNSLILKMYSHNGNYHIIRQEMYEAESIIANKCLKLMQYQENNPPKEKQSEVLANVLSIAKRQKIALSNDQIEAILGTWYSGISIITGGPGTGKTTIINVLKELSSEMNKSQLMFLAPTGRAAKRLSETTKSMARTIHSALMLDFFEDEEKNINRCQKKRECLLSDTDMIVVDEMSMVDVVVAKYLFKAISPETKVVLVGDYAQLPSVAAGLVLKNMIDSGVINTYKLSQIHRQTEDSVIYLNAKKINDGNTDIREGSDFSIYNYSEIQTEEMEKKIIDLYFKEVKKYGIEEVACILPVKRGCGGVHSVNNKIQARLQNKSYRKNKLEVKRSPYVFRVGDLVMNLRNIYMSENEKFLPNGEIGTISEITEDNEENKYIEVKYDNGIHVYDREHYDDLALAYAMTVHKSQGSEYMSVITSLKDTNNYMKVRNIPYTAITRARNKLSFVGSINALEDAILNNAIIDRNTILTELLQQQEVEF